MNTDGINARITSVEEYIKVIIEREKSKPGDNYTFYYKLLQKCWKAIPDFSIHIFVYLHRIRKLKIRIESQV